MRPRSHRAAAAVHGRQGQGMVKGNNSRDKAAQVASLAAERQPAPTRANNARLPGYSAVGFRWRTHATHTASFCGYPIIILRRASPRRGPSPTTACGCALQLGEVERCRR